MAIKWWKGETISIKKWNNKYKRLLVTGWKDWTSNTHRKKKRIKNVALKTYRKDVKFIDARMLASNYIERIAKCFKKTSRGFISSFYRSTTQSIRYHLYQEKPDLIVWLFGRWLVTGGWWLVPWQQVIRCNSMLRYSVDSLLSWWSWSIELMILG